MAFNHCPRRKFHRIDLERHHRPGGHRVSHSGMARVNGLEQFSLKPVDATPAVGAVCPPETGPEERLLVTATTTVARPLSRTNHVQSNHPTKRLFVRATPRCQCYLSSRAKQLAVRHHSGFRRSSQSCDRFFRSRKNQKQVRHPGHLEQPLHARIDSAQNHFASSFLP